MKRLLLVEDNEMNRDMLSRRLERRGYEILLAIDGEQAVEMARERMPDLILLDLSLPALDGWTVARLLREDARTGNLPILALTAHALPGDRERAIEAGCDDYDIKPVEIARLVGKIENLLALTPPESRQNLDDSCR